MAQPWQQGQPGFQYPLQTGIPPNFQQQPQPGFGGIHPQPTGFPGRPQPGFGQQPSNFQLQSAGFQQPQSTGFQQPQPTGFPGPGGVGVGFQNPTYSGGGAGSSFQHRAPPAPPVPQIPGRFQSQAAPPPPPVPQGPPSFLSQPPQSRSFISPQQTGFIPQGGLVPQVTGYVDPRLQVIGGAFMPANVASPYSSAGLPQFAQSQNLQQSIQQINQTRGTATPKIPWALSKAEKKEYDKIFRAWDTSGSGFISGETALQVFGQSGLDKNDLARIWSLADIDDRGKLSLPEFHVAMGLIYRCLNGNTIPDQLPPELIPPSRKDLDNSVDFVKGLLSNDTRSGGITNDSVSRLPVRSFNGNTAENANTRKDGTIYKYNDDDGISAYKPSNRHIDRSTVRTGNESPSSDLTEMRRQLENASKLLDRASAESASRTAEDDALDKEMEDLKYRVRRVQDDLEYVSRGPSSFSKDEERRKLERDLLSLMHERLPELEKRITERDRRKAREKEDWARSRDRANDKYSRFDDGYSSRRDKFRDEEDNHRGYLRGTFERDGRRPPSRNERDYRDRDREHDRDRDHGRDSAYRDRERDYDRERERERDRSLDRNPRGARSPPPVPPATASVSSRTAPPAPSSSPLPTKNMTAEERRIFLQEQAARLVEERRRALGVATPAPSSTAAPVIDSSVQDRIDAERKEAEEKVQRAERELEERERLRQERLQNAKEAFEPKEAPPAANSSAPAPPPATASRAKAAPPPPVRKTVPRPPVTPRVSSGTTTSAPAPPRVAPPISAPTVSRQQPAPVIPQIDPEEEALRAREQSLKKEREARAARLRELEAQEEEERRKEDELQARRIAFLEAKAAATRAPVASPVPPPAPTPTSRVRAPPPPPAPVPAPTRNGNFAAASSLVPPTPAVEPVAPPAPPPPAVISTPAGSQTNPFNRLLNQGSTSGTPPATSGGTNPFARPQPAPVTAPTPPPGKAVYPTASIDSDTDWDDIEKPEEDDSSDEELNRRKFSNLAETIFGGPSSPSPAPSTTPAKVMSPVIPSAPPPPPAPIPPPAPVAPPAPTAPLAPVDSTPTSGDRGALFSQIAGGVPKLRKAITNDRSTAAVAGVVLGDAAPPPHVAAARSSSPPSPAALYTQEEPAATNASILQTSIPPPQVPATVQEEDEYVEVSPTTSIPAIQVDAPLGEPNPLEDIDLNTKYRVRSLYPYQGQRNEDLVFEENLVIEAHPSKSGGDWWYGSIVRSGKTGFFPATYVQQLESVKAKTLYAYAGGSPDELPFSEGEELTLIDRTEGDWWKTERDGMVFIVPAAYLEIVEVPEEESSSSVNPKYDTFPVSNFPVIGRIDEDGSRTEGNTDSSDDTESDSASDVDEDQLPRLEEEIRQDREARKNERIRVLEAAGIVINDGGKQAPPPVSRRPNRRRPAPARPSSHSGTARDSVTSITSITSNRDLPPIPDEARSMDSVKSDKPQLDDAYERYEAFKQQLDQRASIASYDSILPSSPDTLTSGSPKPQEGKGRQSHLLSFLGRRTPANDGERRSVSSLVISGPILTGSTSVSRENSPAFGSSWSSLVDKEALENIPDSERRRQEAIFEFIATENAYLRDLQLIVETFYASLMPKLDPKAITVIFANVEDILLTNTTFLSSLEERQKECRLYIDNIADVLESNMSKMGLYMQYCVNTGNAIRFLQSLRDSRPEIATHLQQLRDDPGVRGLDLSSYILTPMQRITRYPLLIRQIINYTHEQQELQRLEKSVLEIERILDAINEAIRTNESHDRLRQISQSLWIEQGRLDLTQPTRYMGPRKLLKEGALFKAKGSKKLHGILCNDILILAEESARSLYRMPIPLTALRVEEHAGRNDLDFKLVLAYPRGGETISLRATSARDAQNWIKYIEQTREKCIQAEKRTST